MHEIFFVLKFRQCIQLERTIMQLQVQSNAALLKILPRNTSDHYKQTNKKK